MKLTQLGSRSFRPFLIALVFSATSTMPGSAASFSMEQVTSYPYPTELTAAATGSRIAWVFNEIGVRNIWVAEGPDFRPRRLTICALLYHSSREAKSPNTG